MLHFDAMIVGSFEDNFKIFSALQKWKIMHFNTLSKVARLLDTYHLFINKASTFIQPYLIFVKHQHIKWNNCYQLSLHQMKTSGDSGCWQHSWMQGNTRIINYLILMLSWRCLLTVCVPHKLFSSFLKNHCWTIIAYVRNKNL